jgi:hypothetical protein
LVRPGASVVDLVSNGLFGAVGNNFRVWESPFIDGLGSIPGGSDAGGVVNLWLARWILGAVENN